MEDDHSDPAAAKRVRILSTLDAPRAASRKGGLRPPTSAHRAPGRSWALWVLMGGGLACAAGGWWLSSMADAPDPTPGQAIAQAAAPTASAASVGITPAASTPAVAPAARALHPDAPLTALIESSPPSATPSEPASAPTSAAASAADTANPLALLSTTPAPPPTRAQAQAQTRTPTSPKPHTPPQGKGKPGKSDDVALLEAMFAHAGHRKPPRSASEELERRCGPLNGAEARACRIKVCKRYPDARVCR